MKRPKSILLIIAGALASIATEQATGWTMSAEQSLAMATLENQTPSLRYLVHAELHGPGPFDGLDGWLDSRIYISPSQPSAVVTIEVRSLTHPDVMVSTGVVPADRAIEDVYIDAWLACTSDPCVEDFEVTVKRDPALDLAPITVTGTAISEAGGAPDVKATPPNTEVVVTVTGPMP